MTVIERITELLKQNSLKQLDLCLYIGVKTSTFSNWKSRHTDIPAKHIIPICEYLHVSHHFLLTGTEQFQSVSEEDADWLNLIHQLPPDGKLAFKNEIKGFIRGLAYASKEESTGTDSFPE